MLKILFVLFFSFPHHDILLFCKFIFAVIESYFDKNHPKLFSFWLKSQVHLATAVWFHEYWGIFRTDTKTESLNNVLFSLFLLHAKVTLISSNLAMFLHYTFLLITRKKTVLESLQWITPAKPGKKQMAAK